MQQNRISNNKNGGALRTDENLLNLVPRFRATLTRADVELPKELDLRGSLGRVRNQGSQSSCVAMAGSCFMTYHLNQITKKGLCAPQMSPQFIFNCRKNYPGWGMYGGDLESILKNLGDCKESLYPYGKRNEPKDSIPQNVKDAASKWKTISGSLIYNPDDLKRALLENGPCVVIMPAYNHSSTFWNKKNENDPLLFGHSMAIVGYNKQGFICRNSWGVLWGNKGDTLYPYEDYGAHWEMWTFKPDDYSENDVTQNCC